MKPADRAAIFLIPAIVLMMLGVFGRTLGFREFTGLTLFLIALGLMLLGYRETIKADKTRMPNPTRQTSPKADILQSAGDVPHPAGKQA